MINSNKSVGIGINYRDEFSEQILDNIEIFDFIEMNTEGMYKNNIIIDKLLNHTDILLHGLTLSIGTYGEEVSKTYLENLGKTINKTNCCWFSEHIAITKINGLNLRALMPVEFTEYNIYEIVNKVRLIKSLTNKPFLLENIAYYYPMPYNTISEHEFISKIVVASDCGLLLDINNLYVNSINHKYDPYEFIDRLPLDRVIEVHVAGCDYINGLMVDTHASRVREEVISLFKYLFKKTPLKSVIIERDDRPKDFQEIIDEVSVFRKIIKNG
tara:strand:+ start:1722 stop:2534 length:813 start_codon:yes stop_codon:yes gene_type:complete